MTPQGKMISDLLPIFFVVVPLVITLVLSVLVNALFGKRIRRWQRNRLKKLLQEDD